MSGDPRRRARRDPALGAIRASISLTIGPASSDRGSSKPRGRSWAAWRVFMSPETGSCQESTRYRGVPGAMAVALSLARNGRDASRTPPQPSSAPNVGVAVASSVPSAATRRSSMARSRVPATPSIVRTKRSSVRRAAIRVRATLGCGSTTTARVVRDAVDPCSSAAVMRRSTATFHAGSIIDTEAANGPAAVTITSVAPTSVVPATAAMWIRPSGRSADPRTTMVPPPMTLPSTGTWRCRCPSSAVATGLLGIGVAGASATDFGAGSGSRPA